MICCSGSKWVNVGKRVKQGVRNTDSLADSVTEGATAGGGYKLPYLERLKTRAQRDYEMYLLHPL